MNTFACTLFAGMLLFQVHAQPRSDSPDPLDVYATMTGKIILQAKPWPSVNEPGLLGLSTNNPGSAIAIEKAFNRAGFEFVPDGDKFVLLLQTGARTNSFLASELARLRLPAATTNSQSIPGGAINFRNVPTENFLSFYSELRQRTLIRPGNLPAAGITFHPQQPLTKEETVHALDVIMVLNGIVPTDLGEKFVLILPIDAKTNPLLTSQLARFQLSRATTNSQVLPSGTVNLRSLPISQFLSIYSNLRQRTILKPVDLPSVAITFQNQQSLAKEELVYALNILLVVNGIVPLDEGETAVRILPAGRVPEFKSQRSESR
jgi:hypothetical protein